MAMVRHPGVHETVTNVSIDGPDAYICAKISPPRLPSHLVSRPRLLASLRESLAKKLTLVEAPAGFGKTTILSEWRRRLLADEAAIVAWVTLDRDDEDPKLFVRYVVEALRRAAGGGMTRTRALLDDDPGSAARAIVSVLLDEIATVDADVVLMLDDYDFVESAAVNDIVATLLVHASENVHVCIATRSRVPFHVATWRTARELVEIGVEDLRFRTDETRSYLLCVSRDPVNYWDAHALCASTEGWIAGLQIAVMPSSRSGGAATRVGARQTTWAYLRDNVLAGVSDELRTFLVETSILGQLSVELCAAVTGSARSVALLDELEARNLFVSRLDESNTWFRYHRLFAEFLQGELTERAPHEVLALHRRAAMWFAANGEWARAVTHAMAAGDVDRAEAWIECCAMSLVEAGDLRTLHLWSQKLSPAALRSRIQLRFALAWTLPLLFRFADGDAAIAALEDDDANGRIALEAAQRIELRAIRAMSAALADNDSARAAELAHACLDEMPSGDTWMHRIVRNVATWAYTQNHEYAAARATQLELPDDRAWDSKFFAPTCRNGLLGMGWVMQGRLSRAEELYDDVAGFASRSGRHSPASCYLACFQAELAYERNDLERAGEVLAGRWETINEASSLDGALRAYVCAARTMSAAADRDGALHLLDRGIAIGARRKWKRLVCALEAEKVRLHLLAGRRRRAEASFAEIERVVVSLPAAGCGGSADRCRDDRTTAFARLRLASGAFDEAASILHAAVTRFTELRANVLVVRTSALLAAVYVRANKPSAAQAVFASALNFVGGEMLVRSFLDEGPEIDEPLLRALADSPACDAPIARALAIARAGATDATSSIASLSARERQILMCLAEGNHNKQIASILTVSPETVKWHLKKIYEKLSVGSRTEAARLAMLSRLA